MSSRLNGYRAVLLVVILALVAAPVAVGPAIHKTSGTTAEGLPSSLPVTPYKTFASAASEMFSPVSAVYSWSLGRLDGYTPSDAGFSLSSIQTDNSVYGELQEVPDVLTSRFEVIVSIDTSGHSDYLSHEIQVQGYCGLDQEELEFYWSDSPTGTYTYLFSITSGSDSQKFQSVSITTGTVYVKIVDQDVGFLEGDSTWEIDYVRVRFSDPPPVNDWVSVDQIYDTDNFYPGRGLGTNTYYTFDIASSDESGGATIVTQSLTCKMSGSSALWSVQWSSTGGFTEADPFNRIELDAGLSSTSVSGSRRRTYFAVSIMFAHGSYSDVDWEVYCCTSTASEATMYDGIYQDGYVKNADFVTTLEWIQSPTLEKTDRCNPGESVALAGNVRFTGSATNVYPLTAYAAVSRTEPSSLAWSTTQDLSSGSLSVPCPTTGVSGTTNTFSVTLKEAGTDRTLLGPVSDSVLLDKVVAFDYGVSDGWDDVGSTPTIYTSLKYESDGAVITDGVVTWSGITLSYTAQSGIERWEGTVPAEDSPTTNVYDTISVRTPEGVTAVQTHPSVIVVWDRVRVNYVRAFRATDGVEDYEIAVGDSLYVQVQLQYEEDGGWVTDGTVSVNGIPFSYTGSNGIWQSGDLTRDQVGAISLTSVAFDSEPSSGVMTINQNGKSCYLKWNALMIELSVDDSCVNPDDTVRIWARVTRALDGTMVTAGTVTLRHTTSSDIMLNYDPGSQRWYVDVSQPTVVELSYYLYAITDSLTGITTIGQGGYFDGLDGYIDLGSGPSLDITTHLTISVWFKATGSDWGTGMYLLGKKDRNDAQYALYVSSDGTLKLVYYSGVLREVDLEPSVTRHAWHHVIVTVDGKALDSWYDGVHVVEDYQLPAGLTSFPSVPLYIGAVKSDTGTDYHFEGYISEVQVYSDVLTDIQCLELFQGCYPSTSGLVVDIDRASLVVNDDMWYDLSGSGNDGVLHGIVIERGSLPDQSERGVVTWTQVRVVSYSTEVSPIDVGMDSSCHVALAYAHDGSPVEDGIVMVSGVPATYSGSDGIWDFSERRTAPSMALYNQVVFSGGIFGISSVDQDSKSLEQVWDEILIVVTSVVDPYTNIGSPAEIRVVARLSYYSSHFLGIGDTLYMDGEKMSWSVSGNYFYYRPTQYSAGARTYAVNTTGAIEQTYRITAVDTGSHSVTVVWDGLVVSISDPLHWYFNVHENASGIHISVTYASDGLPYDGLVSLNSTQFAYAVAGKHGYALRPFIGDDSRGITYVVVNDETWCIWDSVIIELTDPLEQYLLVGQNATGIHISAYYASDDTPFDGTVTLNDTCFAYATPGRHGYTVGGVSGGWRGISVISQNDATFAIWSREPTTLHMEPYSTDVPVTTAYDPTGFTFNVWLSDSSGETITGLVNVTIGGSSYEVLCTNDSASTFTYRPLEAGSYTLEGLFKGDASYGTSEVSITGLTAHLRGMTCAVGVPSPLLPMTDETIRLSKVYDSDFQGQYDGVKYVKNYPLNVTFSAWWTLSSSYLGNPNYLGSWRVDAGTGEGQWSLPWDLNGDGILSRNDSQCYLMVCIDGNGIYENTTLTLPLEVLHELQLDIQAPAPRYSDMTTFNMQVSPLYAGSCDEDLSFAIQLSMSIDNKTWTEIGTTLSNATGSGSIYWVCDKMGTVYFKAHVESSTYFTGSEVCFYVNVRRELTDLTIVRASNFTYSDQGVVVGRLTTDDGEPLADRPVFLEIWDGSWVSMGSGTTNSTGYVNILWTPELKPDTYTVQLRAPLSESRYFETPEDAAGQLVVGKETLLISIESSEVIDGSVLVQVTDDDDVPVADLETRLYLGDETVSHMTGLTDKEGHVKFTTEFEDGQVIHIKVADTDYYHEASFEDRIVVPLNLLVLTIALGGILGVSFVVAVGRKLSAKGKSAELLVPSPEVIRELEKERESVPKRIKVHAEIRKEDIDSIDKSEEGRASS